MKKVGLLVAFYFLNGFALAQEYQPMINNSGWLVRAADFEGWSYHWIQEIGDTLIGDQTYQIFDDPTFWFPHAYLREDTIEKRVFMWHQNMEQLVCDFSLEEGDQFLLHWINYTVMEIDSVQVEGGMRKRLYVYPDFEFGYFTEYWIEGVGVMGHPLYGLTFLPSDPSYDIICSYQQGQSIYHADFDPMYTECPEYLSNKEFDQINFSQGFIPNPIENCAELNDFAINERREVTIYDTLGKEIEKRTFLPLEIAEICLQEDQWKTAIVVVISESGKRFSQVLFAQ
jgi:hypothetical protein